MLESSKYRETGRTRVVKVTRNTLQGSEPLSLKNTETTTSIGYHTCLEGIDGPSYRSYCINNQDTSKPKRTYHGHFSHTGSRGTNGLNEAFCSEELAKMPSFENPPQVHEFSIRY